VTIRAALRCSALVLCALVASNATTLAWVPHTATIAAVKVTTPPKLDLTLEDPLWKTGAVFDNFYNFTSHQPAEHETVAYLLYDDENLYLAIHNAQHGASIVATQTVDHAGVATDDNIALNLETSGNGGRVYQFRMNPHGIHDESSSENARYAPDWKSSAEVLPNGDWNAIMVIPLSVIRAQGGGKQDWQIDIVRFVAGTNDEYTWAYEPTMQAFSGSQYWPKLTGLQLKAAAARPRAHADIYGLGAAGADRGVFQNGIGNFEPMKERPYGVDVTVPVTNTMALVGTLNPDFSNVEQDQTTIAPQEFQRQYNEYRPFFSQGANYLNPLPSSNVNSSDIPFYSPNIGVFNSGTKLEGTQGANSIGLLNVTGAGFNDSAFGYSYGTSDQSFDAAVQGVDANHTGLRDDVFGAAVSTTNPHSGTFVVLRQTDETGTDVSAASQAQDFQFSTGVQNAHTLVLFKYADIGPQYNPVDGYLTENDLRGPQFFYSYSGSGPKGGAIKSYQVLGGVDRFVDRSGAAHQADVFSNLSVTFKDQVTLQFGQTTSELRTYATSYPLYLGAQVLPYNSQAVVFGYKDGTPSPVDASYSWGPFANGQLQPVFLQQPSISTSHQFGRWGLSFAFSGAIDHAMPGSPALALDSQWERSLSITRSFGKDTSLALGLRGINGDGGFAEPGTNLAVSFHQRFKNLDELYVDYGTPASIATLNRFIVKYIFHIGGDTGT
jgi:Domain of unknown function (DUF5916)